MEASTILHSALLASPPPPPRSSSCRSSPISKIPNFTPPNPFHLSSDNPRQNCVGTDSETEPGRTLFTDYKCPSLFAPNYYPYYGSCLEVLEGAFFDSYLFESQFPTIWAGRGLGLEHGCQVQFVRFERKCDGCRIRDERGLYLNYWLDWRLGCIWQRRFWIRARETIATQLASGSLFPSGDLDRKLCRMSFAGGTMTGFRGKLCAVELPAVCYGLQFLQVRVAGGLPVRD